MKSYTSVFGIFIGILLFSLRATTLYAQPTQAEQGGTLAIKVIENYILLPVTLEINKNAKETHLLLDYSNENALSLSEQIYLELNLKLEENEEYVHFVNKNFDLPVDIDDVSQLPENTPNDVLIDYLTSRYSVELGDIDVSGVIGFPLLKKICTRTQPQ